MDSTKKKYILIFGWKEAKQKIKTASKDQNAARGDRMAEAWIRCESHGDGFAGLGGYSAHHDTLR